MNWTPAAKEVVKWGAAALTLAVPTAAYTYFNPNPNQIVMWVGIFSALVPSALFVGFLSDYIKERRDRKYNKPDMSFKKFIKFEDYWPKPK